MRAAVALLLVLPLMSGCLDLFGRALNDHDVARTPVDLTGWNTNSLFSVEVRDPESVEVRIVATSTRGTELVANGWSGAGQGAVNLVIPDGTWTLTYFLDGARWETFKDVRFDSTPPVVTGLVSVGSAAADGSYNLGQGVLIEPGARLHVIDQSSGLTIATTLPHRLLGLGDGLHAYDVIVSDAAGNEVPYTVQVRAGTAQLLPEGQFALGLVARYTLDVELWDIHALSSWPSPAEARDGAGQQWLGEGLAIRPNDPVVQQVVQDVVRSDMSSGRAALALFKWMADTLDYDKSRLEESDLLEPAATVANGGGVCRDLAGLYVSLLRAAGIPARLVTGYLGGDVNGFHAWVEFYGGPGHGASPWVPVDVSIITGPYEPDMALHAFGIRHTNMLPLRVISEVQEKGAWATAVSVSVSYLNSTRPEPSVKLEKNVQPEFESIRGVLCVDRDTLARLDVRRSQDCPSSFPLYLPDFERRSSQVLDYGAVITAGPGTRVTLNLAYPDDDAVSPGKVEQQTYGAAFQVKSDGVKQGIWNS